MSRMKSAVLSPADTKTKVKDLKAQLKSLQAADKEVAASIKAKQKEFDAFVKAETKKLNGKAITKLQAELASLAPAAA